MSDGAYVYAPGAGPILEMGPFRMTVKASATGTGGALTLLEADEPANFGPPMHIHQDAAEAFYVLAGEYIVFISGSEYRCPAGSFVWVSPGVVHGFRVGKSQSRKLNIYLPSAMEGYFQALAEAAEVGGSFDDGQLTALAAQHAMTVVGPVPENYV